jgi:hypothetical protein
MSTKLSIKSLEPSTYSQYTMFCVEHYMSQDLYQDFTNINPIKTKIIKGYKELIKYLGLPNNIKYINNRIWLDLNEYLICRTRPTELIVITLLSQH